MAGKKNVKRRQCRLTPEGWVFLIILGFIGVGAVLRNVNLLILATGMMLAPVIFNWRVCVANLRSLSAKRVVPDQVHALTPINVSWTCDNEHGRLPARNLVLRDRLVDRKGAAKEDSLSRKLISKMDSFFQTGTWDNDFAHVCFEGVSKTDPDIVTYQCLFPARGEYNLGPAELKTSYPFGLVYCRIPLNESETVFVAPPLGQLNPTWERRINSLETGGQSRMRQRGLEQDEFYALRKWRSGDSQKNIHWRSSARRGVPMVKQFDEPNDRDFALLLDLHTEDEVARLQCETILSFAATALSQAGADILGQLAIAVCGEETHLVSGRQGVTTRSNVMRRLAVAKPVAEPEIESSIIELASLVSSGTPLYCFSTREAPLWLDSSHADSISPALKSVQHLVRWIRVDSKEFAELFSVDGGTSAAKEMEAAV